MLYGRLHAGSGCEWVARDTTSSSILYRHGLTESEGLHTNSLEVFIPYMQALLQNQWILSITTLRVPYDAEFAEASGVTIESACHACHACQAAALLSAQRKMLV